MNRTVFVAFLRERSLLILMAVLIVVFGTLLAWLDRLAVASGMLRAQVVLLVLVGPLVAAMLGAELPDAPPGGWGWLLARPVSRRAQLKGRLLADLITLVAMWAVAFPCDLDKTTPELPFVMLFLWLCSYGASAQAGALRLGLFPSVGLGLIYGAASGLLGFVAVWVGLVLRSGPQILEKGLIVASGVPWILKEGFGIREYWVWLPFLGLVAGLLAAGAGGLLTARATGALCPRGLEPRPFLGRLGLKHLIILGILAILGASQVAPLPQPELVGGMEAQLADGSVLISGRDSLGRLEERRHAPDGQVLWRGLLNSWCYRAAQRADVTLLFCDDKLYRFTSKTLEPEPLELGKSYQGLRLARLSPDASRLLFADQHDRLWIRSLQDAGPDLALPDTIAGTGPVKALGWGKNEVILVAREVTGGLKISRLTPAGQALGELTVDSSSQPGRPGVRAIFEDLALLIIPRQTESPPPQVSAQATAAQEGAQLVHPDGSLKPLVTSNGLPLRPAGLGPGESLYGYRWLDASTVELWQVPLAGEPTRLGEVKGFAGTENLGLYLLRDPDGPGAYMRWRPSRDGFVIAPILSGTLGQTQVVGFTTPWSLAPQYLSKEALLLPPLTAEEPPQRLPWPSTPAFAQP